MQIKLDNLKFIAFDVDGTLYIAESLIAPSYYSAIVEFNKKYKLNLKKRTLAQLEHQVGNNARNILQSIFPEIDDIDALNVLSEMILNEFIKRISRKEGRIYDNIYKTLDTLMEKGYMLGVATNASSIYLDTVLESFSLSKFFVPPVTIDGGKINSKSDILSYYLDKYNLKTHELLMVGDRGSDLKSAQDVNCHFIGAKYGFSPDEIQSAPITIDSFEQILNYVI